MKGELPKKTDVDALATYVLVVMEGGVMLSRSYGSVEPFDRAVAQLREHFRMLLANRSIHHRDTEAQRKTRTKS